MLLRRVLRRHLVRASARTGVLRRVLRRVLVWLSANSYFQGGPGSVRFGYGLGVERFERFWFSVPAVPLPKGFILCFSTIQQERTVSAPEAVPAVPVPLSVSGKTVPTVPVSSSGSVPEPPFRVSDNLGIRNGGGKQGRRNQPPYQRFGPDTEIQYRPRKPHGLAKPSRIPSQKRSQPRIVDSDACDLPSLG